VDRAEDFWSAKVIHFYRGSVKWRSDDQSRDREGVAIVAVRGPLPYGRGSDRFHTPADKARSNGQDRAGIRPLGVRQPISDVAFDQMSGGARHNWRLG